MLNNFMTWGICKGAIGGGESSTLGTCAHEGSMLETNPHMPAQESMVMARRGGIKEPKIRF